MLEVVDNDTMRSTDGKPVVRTHSRESIGLLIAKRWKCGTINLEGLFSTGVFILMAPSKPGDHNTCRNFDVIVGSAPIENSYDRVHALGEVFEVGNPAWVPDAKAFIRVPIRTFGHIKFIGRFIREPAQNLCKSTGAIEAVRLCP